MNEPASTVPFSSLPERTYAQLARGYWIQRLNNRPPNVGENSIETDGRKRGATIRTLLKEGVIQPTPDDGIHTSQPFYTVTRMFGEAYVAPVRPDLAAMGKVAAKDLHACETAHGVQIDNLSTGALRYVAEHMSEYRFTDDRYRPIENPAESKQYLGYCFVADEAYRTAVAARARELRIAAATRRNLSWGLQKAGHIEPVDADLFSSRDTADSFARLGGGVHTFGDNPDTWGEDAEKIVTELRDRIAKDTRRANATLAMIAKIKAAGGWEKFVAEYKQRVVAAVDEELAAKKQENND